MGYLVRRDVRDHLPPGLLTAAERLLVLEIADFAGETTREAWPGKGALAAATDLSDRSIQELLSRIAKKWVELRVPLGKDDNGKPYYSHRGRRTVYRIPRFDQTSDTPEGATDAGASLEKGATDPGGSCDESGGLEAERCDGSVPKVRQNRGPSSQGTLKENPSDSSPQAPATPADMIRAATDATEEEAEEIVRLIRSKTEVGLWSSFIRKMVSTGDLAAKLADVRAPRRSGPYVNSDKRNYDAPFRSSFEPYRNPDNQDDYDEWGPRGGWPQSTTDKRVAQALALGEALEARERQQQLAANPD